jgi:hypothetical protein
MSGDFKFCYKMTERIRIVHAGIKKKRLRRWG